MKKTRRSSLRVSLRAKIPITLLRCKSLPERSPPPAIKKVPSLLIGVSSPYYLTLPRLTTWWDRFYSNLASWKRLQPSSMLLQRSRPRCSLPGGRAQTSSGAQRESLRHARSRLH